ncbi:MAG TPA: cyclic nucleotide-binding domain-containing protein, partial [Spirochaetia bacterium]|nr:cyclic nucleotide-binding domain-containing protein [Spirochaetia bacterium]
ELHGAGVLVDEGEPFRHMYIIRSGEVNVSRGGKTAAVLSRGDFIGELHDVDINIPSPYRFSHSGDVSLFALSREDMVDFTRQNPGLVMKFKLGYLLEGAHTK